MSIHDMLVNLINCHMYSGLELYRTQRVCVYVNTAGGCASFTVLS